MVENDLRLKHAKEVFKKERETFDLALRGIRQIELAVDPADHTEILNRIQKAADTVINLSAAAERAQIDKSEFSFVLEQINLQREVSQLVTKGLITAEVADYFFGYIAFSQLKNEKNLDGLFGQFLESAQKKMEAAVVASPWTELATAYLPVKAEIDKLNANGGKAHNIPDLEKKDSLVEDSVDKVNWTLLSTDDPATGTPIDAIENFTDFKKKVKYAAALVDGGTPIPPDRRDLFERKIDQLNSDAIVYKKFPNILQEVHNLQALLREIINRSETRVVEKQVEKDDYLKTVIRPPTDEVLVNGVDEVKVFLERVGIKDLDEAEQIVIKILNAADPQKAVTPDELRKLKVLHERIQHQSAKYTILLEASSNVFDPTSWNTSQRLSTEIGRYVEWLRAAISLTRDGDADPYENQIPAPELQAAQEKWYVFFESVAAGPNAYDDMKNWGDTIMKSFYQSAEPAESWKSQLETRRFSAWKDALKGKYKKLKAPHLEAYRNRPNKEEKDRYKDDPEIVKYDLLWKKYDNNRLIIDGMITFGQSRGMTADWHNEEMLKKLQAESQAQHGFKPEALDFFSLDQDTAREYAAERILKPKNIKKLPKAQQGVLKVEAQREVDEELDINHYPHAEQMRWSLDEMKKLLRTPGSGFYRKEWNDDDLSKEALKKEVKKRLSTRNSKAENPISEEDIDEVVEIAYTMATFVGLRLDTFAESYIAGDSPGGGTIPPRQDYFRKLCPPTGFFYAAYEAPVYLPEMEFTYDPDDLIRTWKMWYSELAKNEDDKKDFEKRINSIEQSITGTELHLHEYAPLRTHDKKRPFGYNLERYKDGMLKWQYPSMYRYIFDPELQKQRIIGGMTFFEWVQGYQMFEKFREIAHADLSVEGKSPEDAAAHLMRELNKVFGAISGLKANMLVDWNYICNLTVAFVDRMFRAFSEVKGANPGMLYDLVTPAFGGGSWKRKLYIDTYKVIAPDLPQIMEDMSNNKLNTAGPVDLFRTLPNSMTMEQKKKEYEIKIKAMQDEARKKGDPQSEVEKIGRDELKIPFARAVLEQIWKEGQENNLRQHMEYHLLPDIFVHPELVVFNKLFPGFHHTFKPMGVSTESQKQTATERDSKKH